MGSVNSDRLAHSVGDLQPPSISDAQPHCNKISQISIIDTSKNNDKLETLHNKLQELEEISQLSALEASRRYEEVKALDDELHDLEKETPEEKYLRLYSEKIAVLISLKTQVEKLVKEDDEIKMEIVEQENLLKGLNTEITEMEPVMNLVSEQDKEEEEKT